VAVLLLKNVSYSSIFIYIYIYVFPLIPQVFDNEAKMLEIRGEMITLGLFDTAGTKTRDLQHKPLVVRGENAALTHEA